MTTNVKRLKRWTNGAWCRFSWQSVAVLLGVYWDKLIGLQTQISQILIDFDFKWM